MSYSDRISLSGDVSLRCSDGDFARACITRHVTLSAGLRLFLRCARVTRRWTSRESVYRPRARVVHENEAGDRSERSRQDDEPDPFEVHLEKSCLSCPKLTEKSEARSSKAADQRKHCRQVCARQTIPARQRRGILLDRSRRYPTTARSRPTIS